LGERGRKQSRVKGTKKTAAPCKKKKRGYSAKKTGLAGKRDESGPKYVKGGGKKEAGAVSKKKLNKKQEGTQKGEYEKPAFGRGDSSNGKEKPSARVT